MRFSPILATSLAVAAAAGLSVDAQAHVRRWPTEPANGYVTAESRYGPQTITAPVRIGHLSQVDTFITDRCDLPAIRNICRDSEVELIETTS